MIGDNSHHGEGSLVMGPALSGVDNRERFCKKVAAGKVNNDDSMGHVCLIKKGLKLRQTLTVPS